MENYQKDICALCGKAFVDGDTVRPCPQCGKLHHEECWIKNNGCANVACKENRNIEKPANSFKKTCSICNRVLIEGQLFCPECGNPAKSIQNTTENTTIPLAVEPTAPTLVQPAGPTTIETTQPTIVEPTALPIEPITYMQPKKKVKSTFLILIIIVTIILLSVLAVTIFFITKSPSVDKIILKEELIELDVGETQIVSYNIEPKDANDDEVVWESSDESVAEVDERGEITAVGAGSCEITISIDDESETLNVTVKEKVDFKQIYLTHCSPSWAECDADGSYLSIDTNPDDVDDDDWGYSEIQISLEASEAVEKINEELGLPNAIYQEMGRTNALDGRQTRDFEDIGITVTWKYHPNNGLEVIYRHIS